MAFISGNTVSGAASNVYFYVDRYLTLSTTTPPAPGMWIGVHTSNPSGIIVNSGARSGDQQYFFADQPGKSLVYENNQLIIR
ncbi:MAG: hypothetical protein FWG02_04045 [Holophagaceae bacterium]|nr:hypothetical protein [Holophagaceae bacterium]